MAFAGTVIGALLRFLPDFLRVHPVGDRARQRAVWALTHCRTATMGGHVHACEKCGATHFAFHSCNHRSCPQCGKQDTADWVERELGKRIGAPYFMVTFTLPQELRALFFTPSAKAIHEIFFAAASEALSATLANPRWLGARRSGFTMILHTWNQRLHFHPHIHCIVPGAGFDREGRVVRVKSPGFLVPQPVLRATFRHLFEQKLHALRQRPEQATLPGVEAAVWKKDWGVHLQPFGDGQRIIQYLGRYVCRTAISDARILAVSETTVTFSWKDRAHGNAKRTETISGVEFVTRYLRHVLPLGLRAIRRYGYCHPAAKILRERLAFHTGIPLNLDAEEPPVPKPAPVCHCCKQEMAPLERILARWKMGRDPPRNIPCPT
jgi:hypothetical protein